MIKKYVLVLGLCVLLLGASACSTAQNSLQDGYYTVEMSDYSNGWKEFATICVSGGKIVTVEYNAKNSSGFIKSWDMAYMKRMEATIGTYPNRYTRAYAASLLQSQGDQNIDGVSGATHSGGNFTRMAALLIEKAKAGDASLGIVPTED